MRREFGHAMAVGVTVVGCILIGLVALIDNRERSPAYQPATVSVKCEPRSLYDVPMSGTVRTRLVDGEPQIDERFRLITTQGQHTQINLNFWKCKIAGFIIDDRY